MSLFYPARQSILKWPRAGGSSRLVGHIWNLLQYPEALAMGSITHPGITVTVPGTDFSRDKLDLSIGSAITTGLTVRAKPVPVQMLDLLIWANGIDNVQVYEPTSDGVYDLGITAPSSAPTLADTGTGSFTGEYAYAYRYYRSATGEFSALSSIGTYTASGAGSLDQGDVLLV